MYNYNYEDSMKEKDKLSVDSGSKNIDVGRVIKFQDDLVDFVKIVNQCVNQHIEFWNELNEINPDISKLSNLGS